jgi:hypothetical protein
MLVTLAGHDIIRGRALQTPVSADDYAHFIIACLFHDIGYVRGLLAGDDNDGFVVDLSGGRVKLARGASDAAVLPHHVDRSKLFVMERFKNVELLDAGRIAGAVEATRFHSSLSIEGQANEEADLLRAADLIGASSAILITSARQTPSITNSRKSASIGSSATTTRRIWSTSTRSSIGISSPSTCSRRSAIST